MHYGWRGMRCTWIGRQGLAHQGIEVYFCVWGWRVWISFQMHWKAFGDFHDGKPCDLIYIFKNPVWLGRQWESWCSGPGWDLVEREGRWTMSKDLRALSKNWGRLGFVQIITWVVQWYLIYLSGRQESWMMTPMFLGFSPISSTWAVSLLLCISFFSSLTFYLCDCRLIFNGDS